MAITYEPISTTTLGSAASSVTFSSIPATYTDLVLICSSSNTAGNRSFLMEINSDTGSNYSYTYMQGDGSSAASPRASNQTKMQIANFTTVRGTAIAQLQNYSNTTTYKTVLSRGNAADTVVQAFVGLWRSTAAINSITLSLNADNLAATSTFTLYGIKSA